MIKSKNMKKIIFNTLMLPLFIFIIGCQKDELLLKDIQSQEKVNSDYKVSIDNALEIGFNHFELRRKDTSILKSGRISPDFKGRIVKDKKTIRKNETDLFHIINFEGGGYMIIAADKRVTPILGYSVTDNLNDESLPGISEWIDIISSGILKAKVSLDKPREKEARLWEIFENQNKALIIEPPSDECYCDEYYWSFSTGNTGYVDNVSQWQQSYGYSWYCPTDGGCNCGRKPAGCGPVAMAMIMNYYESPSGTISFNGESLQTSYPMPRRLYSVCDQPPVNERQVSMLIRLCGIASNSNYGILGNCSTATHPSNINNGFSLMGYSNGGSYGSLSDKYQVVKNELKTFHPVVFSGTNWFLGFSNWHIWVGDGYEEFRYEYETTYYDENGNPHCGCVMGSSEFICMNWGWGPNNGNGYVVANYSFTNEKTGDNFDTYLKAITGIRP